MEGNIEKQNVKREASPETPEQLPSPEVIERVMAKVQDINEYGTAFSVVSWEYPTPQLQTGESRLKSIFVNGLIGTYKGQEGLERHVFANETRREIYEKGLRERKKPEVFFIILGRLNLASQKVEDTGYFDPEMDSVGVIFDKSSFEEVPLLSHSEDLRIHTFSPYDYLSGHMPKNSRGETITDTDIGFRLSPRVPPRYLRGVVFTARRRLEGAEFDKKIRKILEENRKMVHHTYYEVDENWLRNQKKYQYETEHRPQYLTERARQIAMEMMVVNREKTEFLIPIYDSQGNLWWPKQMSYEEVKRHIDGRRQIDSSGTRPSVNE